MGTDLYRLEFHNTLSHLDLDELNFLDNFRAEDGTLYIDNDRFEEEMEEMEGEEVPERLMELYKQGVFKEGVSFLAS